ncbi:recombinase family protein [Sphingomonas aerophila]|uniref:DNA invertase Pin-like site-specific DNA recombinase n=1 Tax=Sphingomonas aerophila TaxID=1344948 RepID=A0A7W9BGN4_9SPHN|nr:recombinase family protein [Sphingomonas aerophila]MBB5716905.1 DNA invertase Pin-like site-specific DNA recombinase [Sphingomonas aerophila]
MRTPRPPQVRCAVYTRKSSEEGLEQSFNSLDAQREACSAYILSQASDGWCEVADKYDDGGLSGGTLERPALQRLLGDVAAGRVDIIVVYKVDRLTRSLLDFARLVEAFDTAGTSFVSVTQSFNTTTSMGRLTLNMLLSFAQFEREVTAERIRDKIAASKARGMWMGGISPLGYEPDGRSLKIVDNHAAITRTVFTRYLELGNVRRLAESLERDGVLSPARTTRSGKTIGGVPFTRGQLYLMLKCRTFLGEIAHKDQVYPGLHDAIIERGTWDAVQAMLAANLQGSREGQRGSEPSLLAGKLTDDAGVPLVATHAVARGRRYRYYTSQALQTGTGDQGLRIPAREIETVVTHAVAKFVADPLQLANDAHIAIPADDYARLTRRAEELSVRLKRREWGITRQLVAGVRVERGRISVGMSTGELAAALDVALIAAVPATVTISSDVRLTRSGRAMRLIHTSAAQPPAEVNPSLVRLLAEAHRYWRELRKGEQNVTELAQAAGVSPAYLTRVLRLAFLSPTIDDAILSGRQRAGLDVQTLTAADAVPPSWQEQASSFL